MGAVIFHSGLASAVGDYTNEWSALLVGLVSVVWMSVGLIVLVGIQHFLSQCEHAATRVVASEDEQDAA